MNNIIIQDRDKLIMDLITKYRFLLARHIRCFAFSGQRACDRRLKKLIDVGYIKREHILYGTPALYFITPKGKQAFKLGYITQKVRIEQIQHEIYVVDTAIYFMDKLDLSQDDIITERQLKNRAGFGNVQHYPDLVFSDNTCVEVELTMKALQRFTQNVKANYLEYDKQYWVISDNKKLKAQLEKFKTSYPNIEIIHLEEVIQHVKNR